MLWAETPTNPLPVADLAGLARLVPAADAPMIVEDAVATGLLQKPLDLGALASLCSLTRRSLRVIPDVLLGTVLTRDPGLLGDLRNWRTVGGGIPGPFFWLALRGLKTLALRVTRQSEARSRSPGTSPLIRGSARSTTRARTRQRSK